MIRVVFWVVGGVAEEGVPFVGAIMWRMGGVGGRGDVVGGGGRTATDASISATASVSFIRCVCAHCGGSPCVGIAVAFVEAHDDE